MSTPVPSSSGQVSASTVALVVLAVAVLGSAPWVVTAVAWLLHQAWITLPALLIVAVTKWRPKFLLAAVLLGRQAVVQRQAKTETA